MSNRSRRLRAVARLAALREQQQLAQASEARAVLERQQGAYRQLEDYRQDYLSARPQGRQAASDLANAMRFLQDIEAATRVQEARLDAARTQWRGEQAGWEQLHAKRQRLDDWVEQARGQELREREKQRQRDLEDSWVAQRSATGKRPDA